MSRDVCVSKTLLVIARDLSIMEKTKSILDSFSNKESTIDMRNFQLPIHYSISVLLYTYSIDCFACCNYSCNNVV